MNRILLFFGSLQLALGFFNETEANPYLEGFSIICACFFIIALQSLCEWQKNRQYEILHQAIRDETVAAIRGSNGLSQTLLSWNLVVGDIITIEAGMRVPADCILLQGMDIICDESMYEGGSLSVHKKISINGEQHVKENPDCFLLTRSLVRSGSGRAVVCAVGKKTRWFKEHEVEDLEDDNEKTPLQ